jgi:tRNA1(Val) A37 N6-methylase TrmN6
MTRAITEDYFFGGRLRLAQFADGHRVGHDTALLAASAPADVAGEIVDLGAGCGAAGLAAALDAPQATLTLVERDADTADLARANLVAAGMAARGRVTLADILTPASRRLGGLAPEGAALALTNPPFYTPGRVRASPDPGRAQAHVADAGGLAAWLRACLALLVPGGALRLIHRADALGEILAALDGRAGAIVVAPVRDRPGSPAIRVLVGARKGSRAPLRLDEGVTLRDAQGVPDARAEALLRGRAKLALA